MTPTVKSIVAAYVRGKDFDAARDQLHSLDPSVMADVLAAAIAPKAKARELLVMVLADVGYPPAAKQFRTWMDDADIENIALPAACALDAFAGSRFATNRLWDAATGEQYVTFDAIRQWFDAGDIALPSEEQWLTELRDRRARDAAEIPPPSLEITTAEKQSIDTDLVVLKEALEKLPPAVQHRIDVAAIKRALPIYRAYAPADDILDRTVAAIEADDRATVASLVEQVRSATEKANTAANWSRAHQRWRNPAAKAAGHVAQGVLYACSPEVRNRLGAMHNARDAMMFAGQGFAAIRSELDQQLAAVRDA